MIFWRAYDEAGCTYTGPYRLLDRQRLTRFEVVADGAVVIGVEFPTELGRTLIYRRRSILNRSLSVFHIVRVLGAVHAVEESSGERFHAPDFVEGDRVLYPPTLLEGESWT